MYNINDMINRLLHHFNRNLVLNQQQNIWAAYQVSMRVLEVTICTLLAVIATTPLRSEFDGDPTHSQRHSIPHPGHPLHQHLQHQHLNGTLHQPASTEPGILDP